MYDNVCYKKPFLKEVIFKIDFPTPVAKVEKGLSPKVTKNILSKFPIFEPQKAHAQEFQFSGKNFQAKSSEIMQWIYHGKSREKSFIVTPDAITYVNRSYITFEALKDDIKSILDSFFADYKEIASSRAGLRYVNILDVKEDDPLAWDKYINKDILGVIDFHEEKQYLTRAFHILEYNFNGLAIKYQFGIANPDFPATIRKKQFVLDIDAYSHGAFELHDIIQFIDDAHAKIQEIFEKSITEQTRELMVPENVE